MKNVKSFAILLFGLLFWLSAISQDVQSIENTTWLGIDNDRDYQITFLPEGKLSYKVFNGKEFLSYTKGSWSQKSNTITIEINDRYVIKNGVIQDSIMSGNAKNKVGKEWIWKYQLMGDSSLSNSMPPIKFTKFIHFDGSESWATDNSYIDMSSIRLVAKDKIAAIIKIKYVHKKQQPNGEKYIEREQLVDCGARIAKSINWVTFSDEDLKISTIIYREPDEAIDEYLFNIEPNNSQMKNIDYFHEKACPFILKWISENKDAKPIRAENPIDMQKKYIPLDQADGVYYINAEINDFIKAKFVLDTGASDLVINKEVFNKLWNSGLINKSDMQGYANYKIANGTTHRSMIINIRKIKIHSMEIKNVRASVSNEDEAPLLLGQSVLKKMGSWRINSKTNKMEIN